jgi:hypothetical protein
MELAQASRKWTYLLDGNEVTISSNKASYPSAPDSPAEAVYPVSVIFGKSTRDDSVMLLMVIALSGIAKDTEGPPWFNEGASNE